MSGISLSGRIGTGRPFPIHNINPPQIVSELGKAIRTNAMMRQLVEIRNQHLLCFVDRTPVPLSSDPALAVGLAISCIPEPSVPLEPGPVQGPMPCQRIIDLP